MQDEFEEVTMEIPDTEPGESPTHVLNADGSRLGGGGGGSVSNATGEPPTFPRIGTSDDALLEENGAHREVIPETYTSSGDPGGLN